VGQGQWRDMASHTTLHMVCVKMTGPTPPDCLAALHNQAHAHAPLCANPSVAPPPPPHTHSAYLGFKEQFLSPPPHLREAQHHVGGLVDVRLQGAGPGAVEPGAQAHGIQGIVHWVLAAGAQGAYQVALQRRQHSRAQPTHTLRLPAAPGWVGGWVVVVRICQKGAGLIGGCV
jgi:hypothetical protein